MHASAIFHSPRLDVSVGGVQPFIDGGSRGGSGAVWLVATHCPLRAYPTGSAPCNSDSDSDDDGACMSNTLLGLLYDLVYFCMPEWQPSQT
eukprot:366519-Chlamydomonas_euryale.AAC.20